MYFNVCRLIIVWLILFGLMSCASDSHTPVAVTFSNDSTSIVFSGIEQAGLYALRNSADTTQAYAKIISVIEVAGSADSMGSEQSLSGRITTTDSTMIFHPDVPFLRGKRYQVTTYLNARFGNMSMLMKGKVGPALKPQITSLIR